MNKFMKFYQAAGLCLGLLVATPAFADAVQVGNLFYEVNQETKTATVVNDASYAALTSVVIPGTVSANDADYKVTTVGTKAFYDCKALTELTIEEGVTLIEKQAFQRCTGLASINLPLTLTEVGQSGFSGCSSLTSLVLPANLTKIGQTGFSSCSKLVELTLPANIKIIDNAVFQNATALKTVNFNEGLETITGNAFYGCGFESVALPSSIKTIGTAAFSNCNQLKSIEIPDGATSIGDQAFYKCSALAEIKIPVSVESIGMAAFYECKALNGVKLSSGLKNISSNAFYGCSSLTAIEWPEQLTEIQENMFYECTSLADVKLHDGITYIGKLVFRSCTNLKSIKLPSKLTTISNNLFDRCSGLTHIDIPETVTSIGGSAFYLCTGLEELNISEKVLELGSSFITGCTSLKRVNIAEGNPNFADIDGVVFNKAKTLLRAYPAGHGSEYVIPESTEEIFQYAFNSNTVLKSVTFSKNLKTIGLSAFATCSNLSCVLDFPDTLEKIGDTAFFMCRGVSGIRMPNNNAINVEIGNNAFSLLGIPSMLFPEGLKNIGVTSSQNENGETVYSGTSVLGSCTSAEWISLPSTLEMLSPLGSGCSKLKAMYCFAVVPPVLIGSNNVSVASVVKVPKGSAEAYKAAWSERYPNMTFEDALPLPPTVSVAGNSATVSWEPYTDEIYTGTPVRYVILLDDAEVAVLEGDAATGSSVSYTFNNLLNNTYNYTIKGFSAQGELSMLNNGQINVTSSAIDEVEAQGEAVSVEYYDMTGRKVATPAANNLYVVRTVYADGKVKTTKELVK